MFDFTHLREITGKMEVESLDYAKNFWQKIFDILEFDEDFLVENNTEFFHLDLPDDVDPSDFFFGVHLNISYSSLGDIKIQINWDKEELFNESSDRILKEALLRNGFVLSRGEDNLYICNINKS